MIDYLKSARLSILILVKVMDNTVMDNIWLCIESGVTIRGEHDEKYCYG